MGKHPNYDTYHSIKKYNFFIRNEIGLLSIKCRKVEEFSTQLKHNAGDHPPGCTCCDREILQKSALPNKESAVEKIVMDDYLQIADYYRTLRNSMAESVERIKPNLYQVDELVRIHFSDKKLYHSYDMLAKELQQLELPDLFPQETQDILTARKCIITLFDEIIVLVASKRDHLLHADKILKEIVNLLDKIMYEEPGYATGQYSNSKHDNISEHMPPEYASPNHSRNAIGNVFGSVISGVVFGVFMAGAAVVDLGTLLMKSMTQGRKTQKSKPIHAKEASADLVQFRGVAPSSIEPGEYFNVKVMMYRDGDYLRAEQESALVANNINKATSSVYQAEQGQEFHVALQCPDVEMDIAPEYMRWNGVYAAADFEVFLPESFDRKQLRLRGRVYSGDAVITDLKLILQVSSASPQNVVCEKVRLRSAFISYASADRAKVVARLQGIMLACPDMDLFFDVESLRRGEAWEPRLYKEISQRDLFYLFWSHNAAASEWVRKELEYAVAQKTVEFIEPIPLEQPDVCPPPESLMCKHFNDWTLRYLNNQ